MSERASGLARWRETKRWELMRFLMLVWFPHRAGDVMMEDARELADGARRYKQERRESSPAEVSALR